jgi:hypothetical protein
MTFIHAMINVDSLNFDHKSFDAKPTYCTRRESLLQLMQSLFVFCLRRRRLVVISPTELASVNARQNASTIHL